MQTDFSISHLTTELSESRERIWRDLATYLEAELPAQSNELDGLQQRHAEWQGLMRDFSTLREHVDNYKTTTIEPLRHRQAEEAAARRQAELDRLWASLRQEEDCLHQIDEALERSDVLQAAELIAQISTFITSTQGEARQLETTRESNN